MGVHPGGYTVGQPRSDTQKPARREPPDMVTAAGLVVLGAMILVNTVIAAIATRLLRVRLDTTWGKAVYVALVVPVVLVITSVLLGMVTGPSLGSRAAVLGLLVVVPFAVGVSFDLLWMPAPEEVELPTPAEED